MGWLLVDVGCALVPVLPAMSPLLKGAKAVERGLDAGRAVERGQDFSGFFNRMDEATDNLITVRHYTNSQFKLLVEESRYVARETHVTVPGEIPHGFGKARIGRSMIEGRLGIQAGKGDWFIDIAVKRSQLMPAPTGTHTQEGAIQWILWENAAIGDSRFLPWYAW